MSNVEKLNFSPDGEYLIALCSNGELVKYKTENLQEIDRVKTNLSVNNSVTIDFADENTICLINGFKYLLVDLNTMQEKSLLTNVYHYMKNNKKLIAKVSEESGYVIVYFDYLSTEELLKYAQEFLDMLSTTNVSSTK